MGNICVGSGNGRSRKVSLDSIRSPEGQTKQVTPEELEEQRYEDMLRNMKEYHKSRLRQELMNDPRIFILDNLLMCIQFFDNYEKARDEANAFKRNIEREMTEKLANDPLEGMILGDRRIKLLSGMSHVVAQNYIYNGNVEAVEEIDSFYGGVGLKDTFMTDGLLPLEFNLTWDNLEVYDQSEYEDIKEYSHAKGASPIARFCMEQPVKTAEFQGYVRLQCVDRPINFRKELPVPHHSSSDFGYAGEIENTYNLPHSDGVLSESSSVGEGTPPPSIIEEHEDEVDRDMREFREKLSRLENPISRSAMELNQQPSTSRAALAMQNDRFMTAKERQQERNHPEFVVHAPTTPPVSVFNGKNPTRSAESGFEYPHSSPTRILNQQHSKSVPSLLTPNRDSPGKESSGYDTTSTKSIYSSIGSEVKRERWQKHNLKRLTEFGRKSRKTLIPLGSKYDPIPQNCYDEIKFEKISLENPDASDDSNEDESTSSSGEESESDNYDGYDRGSDGERKKNKKDGEATYEMRLYLNSLQVSANACSEFNYVGLNVGLPSHSLTQGVVLGTTIRIPIQYQYPKEKGDDDGVSTGCYDVTYSFTPALHSKSWPQGLIVQFIHQLSSHAHRENARGEKWPSQSQMEQIQLYGCNAIPLGYRSPEFFNAEQILEWELNFQDSEIDLLNSLRGPQWRAYIFAATLFRAFIAPLGPQGIGHEHIRNLLYFMCHKNFSGWNDEQPGNHLEVLFGNFLDCLSRSHMPSFFIRTRNLLQGIPKVNLNFLQAHVKRIRENILIYCIYAFRNLKHVKKTETSYELPSFKNLYEILTTEDVNLLAKTSAFMQMQKDQEDENKREQERQKQRRSRKKKGIRHDLLSQQDSIDDNLFSMRKEARAANAPEKKKDKLNSKIRKDYQNYLKEKEKRQLQKEKEEEKLKSDPEHRVPEGEKRASINLRKSPILRGSLSIYRILLVVQFFLKQFLDMADKAVKIKSYSQATMYVMHIENLCELVQEDEYKQGISPFEEDDFVKYRQETLRLRAIMGSENMHQYIKSRQSLPPTSTNRYPADPMGPGDGAMPTFLSNWDLRKLPVPPTPEREIYPPAKKFEIPKLAASLQSLQSAVESSPAPRTKPTKLPSDRRVLRRQESIKFMGSSVVREETPPATPPRPRSPAGFLPRQSINLSMDHLDGIESTDL